MKRPCENCGSSGGVLWDGRSEGIENNTTIRVRCPECFGVGKLPSFKIRTRCVTSYDADGYAHDEWIDEIEQSIRKAIHLGLCASDPRWGRMSDAQRAVWLQAFSGSISSPPATPTPLTHRQMDALVAHVLAAVKRNILG